MDQQQQHQVDPVPQTSAETMLALNMHCASLGGTCGIKGFPLFNYRAEDYKKYTNGLMVPIFGPPHYSEVQTTMEYMKHHAEFMKNNRDQLQQYLNYLCNRKEDELDETWLQIRSLLPDMICSLDHVLHFVKGINADTKRELELAESGASVTLIELDEDAIEAVRTEAQERIDGTPWKMNCECHPSCAEMYEEKAKQLNELLKKFLPKESCVFKQEPLPNFTFGGFGGTAN